MVVQLRLAFDKHVLQIVLNQVCEPVCKATKYSWKHCGLEAPAALQAQGACSRWRSSRREQDCKKYGKQQASKLQSPIGGSASCRAFCNIKSR